MSELFKLDEEKINRTTKKVKLFEKGSLVCEGIVENGKLANVEGKRNCEEKLKRALKEYD